MAAVGLLRPKAATLGQCARSSVRTASPSSPGAVDIHSHWLPHSWPDWEKRYGGSDWPSMRHQGTLPDGTFGYNRKCSAMLMKDGEDFRPVTKACWDIPARLEDLDAHGIEHQVLSATPILFQWHQPAQTALDVSRYFNDSLLELVSRPEANGRLHSLCQVPLQDVDMACEELSRAKKTGHKGVQIGNHVGNKDLDDEGLIEFLRHCAEEDMPVLVHPWDMANPDERLTKYMMGWTVGMPMETHLSIVAMILSGAFDQLPTNLRLCFAHGGGAFPHLIGRLENAWIHREIARGKSQHPPSYYLNRFTVDSAVFGQRELRLLNDLMGTDRIMLGSDYPFPLGEQKIGSLVRASDFLSEGQKSQILRGNACNFFNIAGGVHEPVVEVKAPAKLEGLRVDPLDGETYNFPQMLRFYTKRYQAVPIQSYWQNKCKKVDASSKDMSPQKRRDPLDGKKWNFDQMMDFYTTTDSEVPIKEYWDSKCIPVPGSKSDSKHE